MTHISADYIYSCVITVNGDMLVVQTYGCNSVSRSKLNHADCVDIGVAQILNEKMGIGVAISVIHSKTGHGAGVTVGVQS